MLKQRKKRREQEDAAMLAAFQALPDDKRQIWLGCVVGEAAKLTPAERESALVYAPLRLVVGGG